MFYLHTFILTNISLLSIVHRSWLVCIPIIQDVDDFEPDRLFSVLKTRFQENLILTCQQVYKTGVNDTS